jgi:large subunit ribosomal protein LP1
MAFANLSDSAKEDMAVSLAVLALHDGGVEVSAENISAILAAAGVTVAPYWAPIFAKILGSRKIDDLLLKPGFGGGSGGGAAAPAASGGAASGGAAKKEEKKEEEEEEDVGGAGGLFGGGDDDW